MLCKEWESPSWVMEQVVGWLEEFLYVSFCLIWEWECVVQHIQTCPVISITWILQVVSFVIVNQGNVTLSVFKFFFFININKNLASCQQYLQSIFSHNQHRNILSSVVWSHRREVFAAAETNAFCLQTAAWSQFKEAVSQCLFTVEIWPTFCQGSHALKFEIKLGNIYSSF